MGTPGGGAPGIGTPTRVRERTIYYYGVRQRRFGGLNFKIYTSIKLSLPAKAGVCAQVEIFVSPGGGGIPGGGIPGGGMPGGGIPGGGGKLGGG